MPVPSWSSRRLYVVSQRQPAAAGDVAAGTSGETCDDSSESAADSAAAPTVTISSISTGIASSRARRRATSSNARCAAVGSCARRRSISIRARSSTVLISTGERAVDRSCRLNDLPQQGLSAPMTHGFTAVAETHADTQRSEQQHNNKNARLLISPANTCAFQLARVWEMSSLM